MNIDNYNQSFQYQVVANCFRRLTSHEYILNQKNTQLLEIDSYKILILQFFLCNRQLKIVSSLNQQDTIQRLRFMHNSNAFFSIFNKNQIQLWFENKKQRYQIEKKFLNQSGEINSIFINQKDSLLIIATNDGEIKFFDKKIGWKSSHFVEIYEIIMDVILNETEDKLIYTSYSQLGIMQLDKDNVWKTVQKISVNRGQSVRYITQNMFAIKRYNENIVQLFQFDEIQQKYINFKNIEFPEQPATNAHYEEFMKQQSLYCVHLGNKLYFLMFNNNKKLLQIEYRYNEYLSMYDKMNFGENGLFLITWQLQTRRIQIRKQIFMK